MRKHCRRQRDVPHLQSVSSQKCKAVAPPKRKATAPPKGPGAGKSKARKTKKFLTFEQKVEVLDMLQRKVSHEITARLAGTHVDADSKEEKEEKEEEEDEDDESTEPGRGAPPAYAELSPHFGVLERAAEECGNTDAAFYLSKARMSMIAAHSAKRTRQTDLREFVSFRKTNAPDRLVETE